MKRRVAAVALAIASAAVGCTTSEARPTKTPPPEPPPAAPEPPPVAPAHGPEPGGWYALEALLGKKLDALDAGTCADANGFELASGLWVDERALAVRRCSRFSGPHAALAEDPGPALLTVISDGGRIVFAVATREYELASAKRAAEEILKKLLLAGCVQARSDETSIGLVRCPAGTGWAAVSTIALPEARGGKYAVVFEVATDEALAQSIARALAGAPRE
jgi:hypothetical protein